MTELPTISEMTPSAGVIRSYVSRAQKLTDAPSVFHLMAFTSALAAIVSPHAHLLIRSGDKTRKEPLHLWVLLCGRSNNRKSYSVDLSTIACAPFIESRVTTGSGSREGLENLFVDQPNAYVVLREFPVFLSDTRAPWMRNGAGFWCTLFDGEFTSQAKVPKEGIVARKEKYHVNINICAAGETTATVEASKKTQWTGGMLSRMIMISAGKRKPSLETGFDWNESDLIRIRAGLQGVLNLVLRNPAVTISKEAWSVYKTWDGPMQESIDCLPLAQSTILSRLGRHVKVVAAIFALSCGRSEILAEDMKCAIKLGRYSHNTVLSLPI